MRTAAVLGIIALLLGAACWAQQGPLPGDVAITQGMQALLGTQPGWAFALTSSAVLPLVAATLLAGATLGWWLRDGSGAVATVLAYGLALLADMALRAAVFVVRPAEPLVAVAAPSVSSSLPSTFGLVYGAIFGVALLAGTTAGRAAWLVRLIAAAALITGSGARVVLGGHWASQMIASVAFGLLLALLAAQATSRAARLRTV